MKKNIIILVAALAAMLLASCNESRLDIPQKGVYAEEDFYKTDSDCEQAICAVYTDIRTLFMYYHFCVTELPGDDCYKGASGYKMDDCHTLMLSVYDDTHGYIRREFQKFYSFVYRCNLVIENFAGDKADTKVKKQCVAEALTLRSWSYIYLIQGWGNPPIVDHVLRTTEDFQQPNASKEDLWKFAIESLDEAINSGALESKDNAYDQTKVRVTKEFAMALKGKAQVLSGDYAGAKTTLKAVMDSKKYELIPSEDLADLFFSSEGDHNCESMFETNVNMTDENYKKVASSDNWYSYCAPRIDKLPIVKDSYLYQYKDGWQYFQPTYQFLKAMIDREGIYSYRFKAWFWTYEAMQEIGLGSLNDKRSKSTQKILDDNPADKPSINYTSDTKNDHCGEICGIWHRKLTMGPNEIFNGSANNDGVNRRYFRYAEVLLLYAEACAQLGETSGDGLDALNQITKRAGAPAYTTLNMENVKQEKRFEMWGEGTRFYDLVRWGDAPTVLADHYNTVPVFYGYKKGKSAADINEKGTNIFDVYEIRWFDIATFTGTKYAFRTGKDELYPYPGTEIANNKLLKQNPGW